jgi:ABC-type sugar transport system permease subunit
MNSALASQKKVRRSAISIWISAVVRTIIFTVTCTGLGMAIGLFTGILVQVARSLVHRGAIDMTVAYRYFGFPLAALGGIGALVIFSVIETRTARRLLAGR